MMKDMEVKHAAYTNDHYGQWGAVLIESSMGDAIRHALIIPMRINLRDEDFVFRVKTQRKSTKRALAYTVFRTLDEATTAAIDEADLALFEDEADLISL